MAAKPINLRKTKKLLFDILRPETGFFTVVIVYSMGIGLLTLAVPIAVQTLINTVVNIASTRSVLLLAGILLATLVFSGIFAALRTRVMEYYERRIYARLTASLSLRTIQAPHAFFEGRQNAAITQRYFEIMTLQKNIPSIMIDGFALILQMLVGFTLVSFYHPLLFAFNAIVLALVYLVWRLWANQAKRTAILLSHAKYDTAKWLQDISSAHTFFKSSQHLRYAAGQTEALIGNYTKQHAGHFRYTFSQTVSYLMLYALASAALLGLGGWLVVQGQLSVGQLVAAELIMSVVFFGISRFSQYLKLYYELYGAAEKMGSALYMPQEEVVSADKPIPQNSQLHFHDVELHFRKEHSTLHVALQCAGKYFVTTDRSWLQRDVIHLLKCYEKPKHGWIQLGALSLADYHTYALRQAIAVVDRSLIVECSVREYLRMAAPSATEREMWKVLSDLQLSAIIKQLDEGMDTRLSSLGNPLQPMAFLLLKLAAAVLSSPCVVVLNQHFDAIPLPLRQQLLRYLEQAEFTVLYFTSAVQPDYFQATIALHDQAVVHQHDAFTASQGDGHDL